MGEILFLSFQAFLGLCLARLFHRTGHGRIWISFAFLPFVLHLLSSFVFYFMHLMSDAPLIALSRNLQNLSMLIFVALFIALAMKRWPGDTPSTPKEASE